MEILRLPTNLQKPLGKRYSLGCVATCKNKTHPVQEKYRFKTLTKQTLSEKRQRQSKLTTAKSYGFPETVENH